MKSNPLVGSVKQEIIEAGLLTIYIDEAKEVTKPTNSYSQRIFSHAEILLEEVKNPIEIVVKQETNFDSVQSINYLQSDEISIKEESIVSEPLVDINHDVIITDISSVGKNEKTRRSHLISSKDILKPRVITKRTNIKRDFVNSHACKLCLLVFPFLKDLKQHKRTAHDYRDLRSVVCQFCDRLFSKELRLLKHLECDHDMVLELPHIDKVCASVFNVMKKGIDCNCYLKLDINGKINYPVEVPKRELKESEISSKLKNPCMVVEPSKQAKGLVKNKSSSFVLPFKKRKIHDVNSSAVLLKKRKLDIHPVEQKEKTAPSKNCNKETFGNKSKSSDKILKVIPRGSHVHKRSYRTSDGMYHCFKCDKVMHSLPSISYHARSHFDEQWTCDQCGKVFKRSTNLRNHMKIHSERQHSCELCARKFHTNFHLKRHVQEDHLKIMAYSCVNCDKKFIKYHQYKIHLRYEHGTGKIVHRTCNICLVKFRRDHHLKTHMVQHEVDLSVKFMHQCDICRPIILFRGIFCLRQHFKYVHPTITPSSKYDLRVYFSDVKDEDMRMKIQEVLEKKRQNEINEACFQLNCSESNEKSEDSLEFCDTSPGEDYKHANDVVHLNETESMCEELGGSQNITEVKEVSDNSTFEIDVGDENSSVDLLCREVMSPEAVTDYSLSGNQRSNTLSDGVNSPQQLPSFDSWYVNSKLIHERRSIYSSFSNVMSMQPYHTHGINLSDSSEHSLIFNGYPDHSTAALSLSDRDYSSFMNNQYVNHSYQSDVSPWMYPVTDNIPVSFQTAGIRNFLSVSNQYRNLENGDFITNNEVFYSQDIVYNWRDEVGKNYPRSYYHEDMRISHNEQLGSSSGCSSMVPFSSSTPIVNKSNAKYGTEVIFIDDNNLKQYENNHNPVSNCGIDVEHRDIYPTIDTIDLRSTANNSLQLRSSAEDLNPDISLQQLKPDGMTDTHWYHSFNLPVEVPKSEFVESSIWSENMCDANEIQWSSTRLLDSNCSSDVERLVNKRDNSFYDLRSSKIDINQDDSSRLVSEIGIEDLVTKDILDIQDSCTHFDELEHNECCLGFRRNCDTQFEIPALESFSKSHVNNECKQVTDECNSLEVSHEIELITTCPESSTHDDNYVKDELVKLNSTYEIRNSNETDSYLCQNASFTTDSEGYFSFC